MDGQRQPRVEGEGSTMSESPTNARFPAGALAPARERFTAGTRFPAGRRSPTAPARRGLARRTAKLFPDEP
ncbi:hypothetical protein DBP18_03950 [Streptomyces sp. CS081A]|nr:hypothetical protein DBP18_03950 [Streptomyces sp. CS081A]